MDTQELDVKAELLRLLSEDADIREAIGKAALPAVMASAQTGRLGAVIRDRGALDMRAVGRELTKEIEKDLAQRPIPRVSAEGG